MRPWARWTAKVAVAAAGFAAAGGGLSGTALAGTGSAGTPGTATVLGGTGLLGPVSNPLDVCSDVRGLLGIAVAGCGGGANAPAGPSRAAGQGARAGTDTAGRGDQGPARTSAITHGTQTGRSAANGSAAGGSAASAASTARMSAAGPGADIAALRPTFGDTLDAPGLGADAPGSSAAAAGPAGLATVPGLADLPSQSGPAGTPGPGAGGGSTLMEGGTLSAAASGLSSDSFAAIAIGALLAGAAALKIASRRARDRKAGIGATI